jgi:hypothetical protein
MDSAKGEDYFEWSFRIVFESPEDYDETILTILQDYGCEIVSENTDSIYFN